MSGFRSVNQIKPTGDVEDSVRSISSPSPDQRREKLEFEDVKLNYSMNALQCNNIGSKLYHKGL